MPPKRKPKNHQELKKGKIILKSTIGQAQRAAIQQLADRINLNGFRWEVVDGMFTQCSVRSILEQTQELNINHLGLANNKHKNIIKDIVVFSHYEKLLNLIMPGNNIESIEPIAYLNAPMLWRIDFRDNFIRDIKVFRKLHCPNLVMFRVGENLISDLGQFETCFCPILIEVSVEGNKYLSSVASLIKLQSEEFKQIYGHSSGIVAGERLQSRFKEKKKQISISL